MSVTLPSALRNEIDRPDRNRSAFLERAALAYIASASNPTSTPAMPRFSIVSRTN